MPETPVYRPFALLSFAGALAVGVPVGARLLAWFYLGASAPSPEWLLLHASVQVFGFFATLIVGVAQHLLPRFTGRGVARDRVVARLAWPLGVALALRTIGVATGAPAVIVVGAAVQALAFALFAAWVWCALDPAPLALLRVHLTLSSAWFVVALAVEIVARVVAEMSGGSVPAHVAMRAAFAIAMIGGVIGWVLGVLLRAGPMFVASWKVPRALARGMPAALAVAAMLGALGESRAIGARAGETVSALGEALALGLATAVAVTAGAATRRRSPSLPMLSRSPEEARIFRVAVASAALGALGALVTVGLATLGVETHVVADAVRHLMTVGMLTGVVIAMAFRLIVVLEQRALPWPRLRDVALFALVGAVSLRTIEVIVPIVPSIAPVVAVSGVLAWIAVACVGVNLGAAALPRSPAISAGRS